MLRCFAQASYDDPDDTKEILLEASVGADTPDKGEKARLRSPCCERHAALCVVLNRQMCQSNGWRSRAYWSFGRNQECRIAGSVLSNVVRLGRLQWSGCKPEARLMPR